jgi:hypothetical protein
VGISTGWRTLVMFFLSLADFCIAVPGVFRYTTAKRYPSHFEHTEVTTCAVFSL